MNTSTEKKVSLERIKSSITKEINFYEQMRVDAIYVIRMAYDLCDKNNPETESSFKILNGLKNGRRKIEKKLNSLRKEQRMIKSMISDEVCKARLG